MMVEVIFNVKTFNVWNKIVHNELHLSQLQQQIPAFTWDLCFTCNRVFLQYSISTFTIITVLNTSSNIVVWCQQFAYFLPDRTKKTMMKVWGVLQRGGETAAILWLCVCVCLLSSLTHTVWLCDGAVGGSGRGHTVCYCVCLCGLMCVCDVFDDSHSECSSAK